MLRWGILGGGGFYLGRWGTFWEGGGIFGEVGEFVERDFYLSCRENFKTKPTTRIMTESSILGKFHVILRHQKDKRFLSKNTKSSCPQTSESFSHKHGNGYH